MANANLSNVPHVTAERILDILTDAYSTVINGGQKPAVIPSVMMWGPPGVGKSQIVRQLASRIGEETGKMAYVTDVRLLLFNPVDLRGIPTANKEKTLAVWLKPKIFQMDESDDVVNILFLDEISAAPQSVQASAYQITLDRTVGEHRLPDNCIVIAAGNRTTDKSVAYKMPKALANRMMHFDVKSSFSSWKKWAVEAGINEKVTGFLSFRQNHLMGFSTESDDLAFATPRTWEMVSNILNYISDDISKMYPMIAGLIGKGLATELKAWNKVYRDLPDIEGIFAGKETRVPKSTDALYALTAAMTAYAREHCDDMAGIANSIAYAEGMPPDFSVMMMKDYMYIKKDFRKELMKIPGFRDWLKTKGRLLNGN